MNTITTTTTATAKPNYCFSISTQHVFVHWVEKVKIRVEISRALFKLIRQHRIKTLVQSWNAWRRRHAQKQHQEASVLRAVRTVKRVVLKVVHAQLGRGFTSWYQWHQQETRHEKVSNVRSMAWCVVYVVDLVSNIFTPVFNLLHFRALPGFVENIASNAASFFAQMLQYLVVLVGRTTSSSSCHVDRTAPSGACSKSAMLPYLVVVFGGKAFDEGKSFVPHCVTVASSIRCIFDLVFYVSSIVWEHFFGHTSLGTLQENNGLCHCINPTHVSANEHERFSTVENVRVSKETGWNVP